MLIKIRLFLRPLLGRNDPKHVINIVKNDPDFI